MAKNYAKAFEGQLRSHSIRIPEVVRQVPGIRVFGKRIKSLVFSTDIAIIRNIDADAVLAVYPFTPQPVITQAILSSVDIPVFTGVGGGLTKGKRVVNLALDAEFKGAIGVVVNTPTLNETISEMANTIDIPIVITVISDLEDVEARLEAGASILNVSGSSDTVEIVRSIKKRYPDVPVIATGGPTDESMLRTAEAGADAITYTPLPTGVYIKKMMDRYRDQIAQKTD